MAARALLTRLFARAWVLQSAVAGVNFRVIVILSLTDLIVMNYTAQVL